MEAEREPKITVFHFCDPITLIRKPIKRRVHKAKPKKSNRNMKATRLKRRKKTFFRR